MVTKDPIKYCEIYKEQGCSHVDGFLCNVDTCEERIKFAKLKEIDMRDINLYKFYWYCGRMGQVEGLFISTQEQVDELLGKEIYFGEILGKHSQVYGTIEEEDITLVSSDQDKVNWLFELLGVTVSGYNPFDYYEPEDEEDEGNEKIDTSS